MNEQNRSETRTADLQDTTAATGRTTRERIQAGLNMYLAAEARHAHKVALEEKDRAKKARR